MLKPKYFLYLAWVTALLAMLGSLYFSEVLQFPPCTLCWYQRISIYPVVALLLVGILRNDRNVAYYVLPLSIIGMLISVYHNLLYYHILPESIAPCVNGVSCTTKFVEYFGFLTIPLLSLIALTAITVSMIMYLLTSNHEHRA